MGGLYFPQQITQVLIGSKATDGTRTSIEMESTYQSESATEATKTFTTGGYSLLNLDVLYTMGAAETSNSIEIKLEGSPDRTNFYQYANVSNSGGTSTLAAREFTFVGTNGAAASISFGLDVFYKYTRVSIKETGVSSNKGSVYVEATLSGR